MSTTLEILLLFLQCLDLGDLLVECRDLLLEVGIARVLLLDQFTEVEVHREPGSGGKGRADAEDGQVLRLLLLAEFFAPGK